jgi:hypothetical protein
MADVLPSGHVRLDGLARTLRPMMAKMPGSTGTSLGWFARRRL